MCTTEDKEVTDQRFGYDVCTDRKTGEGTDLMQDA